MNLYMIRPKIEIEDFLLSITKTCETLLQQNHRKAEENLKFKFTKPRETFSFKPPISIEGSWMIGLTNLQVYNPIFITTEENEIFELCTDDFDEFSFTELKEVLEEILGLSDIKPRYLQHDITGPRFIKAFEKSGLEKLSTDAYLLLLMGYAR